MKCKLFIIATSLAANVNAQVDVTSQYITNSSFEVDNITSLAPVNNASDGLRGYTLTSPNGWNVSGSNVTKLLVTKDCYTDNNFGKVTSIPDGEKAYYLRMGWESGTSSLQQSIKLPAGNYQLTVDARTGYANSATSTLNIKGASEVESSSFVQGSASFFASEKWITHKVNFKLETESTVVIGADVNWLSGGSCVMLDNFKLYKYEGEIVETPDPTESSVSSFTEGVITADFVQEGQMKTDLLQMLADFSKYMVNDFQECSAPNSINEKCGAFKGENTMANDERGVRPNADLSMICAFLVKYGKPANVTLPQGVTWSKIEDMAMKSLVFAYSTHKANKLKVCSGGNYWGSTSTSDAVWESSLWAMSVAYSAYFQWDKLSQAQKDYIYKLLKAECNYELGRSIPTGYAGDTKAEENGWEADILAATIGLFPNDDLAPKWFDRLRAFAINSYSHTNDASNTNPIDPEYDNKSVADYYKGQNLYDDYSLQNHNLFHTSYQNVVMQELGEAALAMKMFQLGLYGEEKWKTNALMHNNQQVQDSILNWLALADGELAMPNGNDWSLFLYDQITSYTTQACFQKDPNALMLENLAYKYIKARQKTTTDGSWLLRADVGARRMGVEAHRVMMTYLMHDVLSTASITPTKWDDFNKKYSQAKMIPCQNIVRAASDDRFTCFSWSNGLKSYTGYFAANSVDKNKIVVPYRANNTGNITGWYEVSGKKTNATPVVSGVYNLKGNAYVMNGELNVNDASLNNRFAIYSTPNNAFIYLDYVTANANVTITSEKGGLLAISTDELTKLSRTLYYNKNGAITHKQLDGSNLTSFDSEWMNIDNELGIASVGNGKKFAFGDRGANNSIYTSKLYPMYNNSSRSVKSGEVVDARNLVYYSNVNAEKTKEFANALVSLKSQLPQGWNGVIASDAQADYFFISNFKGDAKAELKNITCAKGAPVFYEQTSIIDSKSSATFQVQQNNSVAMPINVMIQGSNILAQLIDDESCYVTPSENTEMTISISKNVRSGVSLKKGQTYKCYLKNSEVCVENASIPFVSEEDYTCWIKNPAFDGSSAYGWQGSPVVNYNCAEKFNTTFDVYQIIKGLPAGSYILTCQGFYRDGSYANAASNRNAGKEKANAILYANEASIPLTSIFDDADAKGKLGVATSCGYIPDNMEQASLYFGSGLYNNNVLFSVKNDGDEVRIGIKKTALTTNDWTIFDNFKLIRINGDIICDGSVNILDLATLINVLNGKQEETTLCDVNRDGMLNLDDVSALANIHLSK